jgi:hypothetical protein
MPAILTHDFFGKSVFDDVSKLLGFATEDERCAFLLGNQGPDPLFYLCIDPLMHKWEPLGNAMHSARPSRLLVAMHEAAERLEGADRMAARAYVAGFACHYLLDRSVHPLVYHWQYGLTKAGVAGLGPESEQVVHAEVERDLDEAVLWGAEHKTIREYRPYEEVLRRRPEDLLDGGARVQARPARLLFLARCEDQGDLRHRARRARRRALARGGDGAPRARRGVLGLRQPRARRLGEPLHARGDHRFVRGSL